MQVFYPAKGVVKNSDFPIPFSTDVANKAPMETHLRDLSEGEAGFIVHLEDLLNGGNVGSSAQIQTQIVLHCSSHDCLGKHIAEIVVLGIKARLPSRRNGKTNNQFLSTEMLARRASCRTVTLLFLNGFTTQHEQPQRSCFGDNVCDNR